MSLLTQRPNYKPFNYPWAYEAWKLQQQLHWLPTEVVLDLDVQDWKNNLNDKEKNLLTQIFRFFTQADIEVNDCYMTKYAQVFKNTEVKMMLSAFSNMETIHVDAYSHLLDTLGIPEVEYLRFTEIPEMIRKVDYGRSFSVNDPHSAALTMVAFGAFTEGMQLFASFAMLLNFQRFGKMRGMGQIIAWSIRDETLHCHSIIKLFHQYIKECGINLESLKDSINLVCQNAIEHEDAFIDLAFELGEVPGMEANDIKKYIRYIANRRLDQIGLPPLFPEYLNKNPIPWLDEFLNPVEMTNFFENQPTEYTKGATTGDWNEAWATFGDFSLGEE